MTTKRETGTSNASNISNGPAQPCAPQGLNHELFFKSQSVNCGWRVRPSEGRDHVGRGGGGGGGEGRRGRGGQGRGRLPGELGSWGRRGNVKLANTVSTNLMIWDLGPTVKYKLKNPEGREKNFSVPLFVRGGTRVALTASNPWLVSECWGTYFSCRLQSEPGSWQREPQSKSPGGSSSQRAS